MCLSNIISEIIVNYPYQQLFKLGRQVLCTVWDVNITNNQDQLQKNKLTIFKQAQLVKQSTISTINKSHKYCIPPWFNVVWKISSQHRQHHPFFLATFLRHFGPNFSFFVNWIFRIRNFENFRFSILQSKFALWATAK